MSFSLLAATLPQLAYPSWWFSEEFTKRDTRSCKERYADLIEAELRKKSNQTNEQLMRLTGLSLEQTRKGIMHLKATERIKQGPRIHAGANTFYKVWSLK
jgi:hypothetical protein